MTSPTRQNLRSQAHEFRHRLSIADFFEQFRRDESDGFGIVELQAAALSLSRELTGREDHQLVDFARCQVHGAILQRSAE